jgi:hypothetical protein
MTQGMQEQVRALPTIEAETHLVQVGWEMLRRNLVPRSDDATTGAHQPDYWIG